MVRTSNNKHKRPKYVVPHHHYARLFVIALLALSFVTVLSFYTTPSGMLVASTNIVEKKILPSLVENCDPMAPINEYKETISNGDGTTTILTYNACYPGCKGYSIYYKNNMVSQGSDCEKK